MRRWITLMGRTPVRIAVGIGLLAAVIHLTTSPGDLLSAAAALDARYVAAAAALLPVGIALQWWKWRALLHGAAPEVTEPAVLRSLLAGFGLGLLTPGRLGEIARGVALPGLRMPATQLALADRVVSSSVTLVAGAASAAALVPSLKGPALGVAAFAVAGIGFGCWMLRGKPAGRWAPWLATVRAVPTRSWAVCIGGSVLFNLLFFTQLFLLVGAASPMSAAVAGAIPAVFALKTLLPVSFMDLGVRETAAVAILGVVGVPPAVALQAALLLFVINVLVPGAIGLYTLGRGRGIWVRFSTPGLADVR